MNTTRSIIDLKKLAKLNPVQVALFRIFFGAKGTGFTLQKLTDVAKSRLKEKELEGIEKEVIALEKAGFIKKKDGVDASSGVVWLMEQYNTADLPTEQQHLKDGKVKTALTENGEQLPYGGAEVLFLHHAISPEYKAGEIVGKGKIRDFHINEIGMVYCVIEKEQTEEEKKANKKAALCAKRLSNLYFLGNEIPAGAKRAVKLKKNAGYEEVKVEPVVGLEKGAHVVMFNNEWTEKGKHLSQIVEGVKETVKGVKVHVVNTDWGVEDCIKHNVKFAPTLVAYKEGKEVARMEGFPKVEKPNEEVYAFFKALVAKGEKVAK